jgi:1-acyl-sn-glycerol-3-phosphate acyltransferase
MYLLPGKLKTFVKSYYTKWPFIGWTIKMSGFIYVNSKKNNLIETELIEKGIDVLNRGFSLVFFPEGTKSKDGNIGRFKKGGFNIAYESKAEIIPVVLDTWNSIRPGGGLWIRDDKVWMKILKPIRYEEYENITPKDFAKKLRYSMAEELYNIREERRKTQKKYYRKLQKYIELDNKSYEKISKYKNNNQF